MLRHWSFAETFLLCDSNLNFQSSNFYSAINEQFKYFPEIRNRRLQQEALQHLIQLLPTPNRETLWVLLNFLSVVAANSEDQKSETGEWISGNKMDTTNLATVSTVRHFSTLISFQYSILFFGLCVVLRWFLSLSPISLD